MIISIKKTSNGFNFYKDDKQIYSGFLTSRRFKYVKQLYYDEKLVAEVLNGFKFPFKFYFTIHFTDTNEIFTLTVVNLFKLKYQCQFKGDLYEIIPHYGHKTSFFKNGKQIAYYSSTVIEFYGGQRISLVANSDVNLDLLLSFVLALKCDLKNDYSTVSIDLGNLSTRACKFDKDWIPI